MAILPLLRWPDPRLRQPAAPVDAFDAALAALAGDLADTMRAAPGIGITAPHAGIPKRLVVIGLDLDGPAHSYVNPVVQWRSPELARHDEGSVSMPGAVDSVERPARVRVAFQDLAGNVQSVEADGLLAVCLQHEIDQLDGIFWIERLSRLRRDRLLRRYEKLRRAAGG